MLLWRFTLVTIIGITSIGLIFINATVNNNRQAILEQRIEIMQGDNTRLLSWVQKAEASLRAERNKPPKVEIVIKEVPIERVVKVIQPLREFNDEQELRKFIAGLSVSPLTSSFDCDDSARMIIDAANSQGYKMSLQLLDYGGVLYGKVVTSTSTRHVGLSTTIGNTFYYIDSIPPYPITAITNLD